MGKLTNFSVTEQILEFFKHKNMVHLLRNSILSSITMEASLVTRPLLRFMMKYTGRKPSKQIISDPRDVLLTFVRREQVSAWDPELRAAGVASQVEAWEPDRGEDS